MLLKTEEFPLAVDTPEFRDAFGMAAAAIELAGRAKAEAKVARAKIQDAGRRYLMDCTEDADRIQRAAVVYWRVPQVHVSVIAAVLLGDEKKATRIASMLPNLGTGLTCAHCGSNIPFTSRSDAAMQLDFSAKFESACEACKAKRRPAVPNPESYEVQRLVGREDIEALRTMPYREYLLTQHWLTTRNRKLREARFLCQVCNGGGLLDVHHRTYERRGHEDMADLTVLCRACHSKFHDKLP